MTRNGWTATAATWALLVVALLAIPSAAWSSPRNGGTITPRAATASVVTLHLTPTPDGALAIADNPLAGPVEVLLTISGTPPRSNPALPARATVPARGRTVVARLFDDGNLGTTRAALRLHAVPGPPGARPRDVEYAFPLRGVAPRVTQGFGGGFSHTDAENRHAVDFDAATGTPVLAARAGIVMQVEAGVAATGTVHDDPERANVIRILHDDGTMALYAHLQPGGVSVAPGARVRRGDVIGFSGNTGASTGPHLHFVVQANHGLRLVSVPFRMFGPGGILRFDDVTATPAP